MTVNLRTRVELTCWDLIIPMMTKLRSIRSTVQSKKPSPLTSGQFVTKVIIWSAAGLLLGLALSSIGALLW